MRWLFAPLLLAGCRDLLGIDDGKPKQPDAAVDALVATDGHADAGPDGPSACSAAYVHLSGQTHVYKRITAASNWQTQHDACAASGGYLAVPDDATELQSITTLGAGATLWLGISDLAVAGNYMTVLGQTATFLPWAAGEPLGGGNRQCVQVLANMETYANELCGSAEPAVCECAP